MKLDQNTKNLVELWAVNRMAKMSTPALNRAIKSGKVSFLASVFGSRSTLLIQRARLLHEDLKMMGYEEIYHGSRTASAESTTLPIVDPEGC